LLVPFKQTTTKPYLNKCLKGLRKTTKNISLVRLEATKENGQMYQLGPFISEPKREHVSLNYLLSISTERLKALLRLLLNQMYTVPTVGTAYQA
jgi:hypothetical protein